MGSTLNRFARMSSMVACEFAPRPQSVGRRTENATPPCCGGSRFEACRLRGFSLRRGGIAIRGSFARGRFLRPAVRSLQGAFSELRQTSIARYSHQSMRPPRTQKCERQPVCRHTDGFKVGRPLASVLKSQRGAASRISSSSIADPHPHGQRMPTHQFSSPSRASTTSRHGSFFGRLSPSMIRSRRAGSARDVRRRHHSSGLMRPRSSASARERVVPEAVQASRARGVLSFRSPGTRLRL